MYANIIVDISHEQLDKMFQYRVPEELEDTIQVGMQVNVPFGKGNRIISGYIVEITSTPEFDPDRIKCIECITQGAVKAENKLVLLAAWLKHNYGATMNQALKTVIPVKESVRHKEKKAVELIVSKEDAQKYMGEFKRKHNHARVRFLQALMEDEVIEYSLITGKLNISPQTIKSFETMGLIRISAKEYYRNPIKAGMQKGQSNPLTASQKIIADTIKEEYNRGVRGTYLIHGITGSGKTEIYMDLIKNVLTQGKQVIMLIPEISLTYQTVTRFYKRFGDRVSIMNSRLSKGERYDQFVRAQKGDIDIIIGPRSALFTPFENIGLIVMDEEHESTYKSETSPKYHARETAVQIAAMNNASVILGSATPSMESYYRALQGEYKLFSLEERVNTSKLPSVSIIDLRDELKQGNHSVFSMKLQGLIEEKLEKRQQIMLFLNKRGYAGFISCRSCGHVLKCPHCDISLTSHKNGKLICHYCGHEKIMVKSCPECGSGHISGFRAGTQQIEDMIKVMYPHAGVLRMDMDTTSGKDGHEKILSAFSNQEADILIGTQMIVKGHDFPNVTLVGILAADMSLYASDYRAAERTFQLLTQAAGRSGRGEIPGEVVIQTYTPEHYSILAAKEQDYKKFYEHEILYRKLLNYPPINNMLLIKFSSKDEIILEKAVEIIKIGENITVPQYFKGIEEIQVIGPVKAVLYKANDIYSKVIYMKSGRYELLAEYKDRIEDFVKNQPAFKKVNVQFDFNPLML